MRLSIRAVQTSLLSAMLGASIALAIQAGTTRSSVWIFVAIAALVLHAVNFYHGKMVTFDEDRFAEVESRPIILNSLLLVNTVLFLVFCVIAAKIYDPWYIAGGEIVLRVIDIAIVSSALRVGDHSSSPASIGEEVQAQFRYWILFDLIALVLFSVLLAFMNSIHSADRYPITVVTLVGLVVIDLVIEYVRFGANYFENTKRDWDRLAERWDRLQGEFGDRYRRILLHPFVEGWMLQNGFRSCVDLGCGNGCTARALVDSKAVDYVLGVDASSQLIDLARLYESRATSRSKSERPLHYVVARTDLPENAEELVGEQPFGRIQAAVSNVRRQHTGRVGLISLFGAQDCENLDGIFQVVSALIRPDELFLIIFESPTSFNPDSTHTSTHRAWRYSLRRRISPVQIVTWSPVTATQVDSLFADSGPDLGAPIAVDTNFRQLKDYAAAASRCGLSLKTSGEILLEGPPATPSDLEYQRDPKFKFAEFSFRN
jgi:SAM-dependent methyltransferase